MRLVFDELAKKELFDGIEYYEFEVPGLGQMFQDEIKRVLRIIKEIPEIGLFESEHIKKYILHKFPYKILYSIEKDHIYIIAIAHMHREPSYWVNRINPN